MFIRIIFCLIILTGVAYTQDSGLQDSIRVTGDTLYVGKSAPIELAFVNDYDLGIAFFGLLFKQIDSGFVVFDSIVYINRLADPFVMELRGCQEKSTGLNSFGLKIFCVKMIGNSLPNGDNSVILLYLTGVSTGKMLIDSTSFPPTYEFSFIEWDGDPSTSEKKYSPAFVSREIVVVDSPPLPYITFDNSTKRITAGVSITFDIDAGLPTGEDVDVAIKEFSKYDELAAPSNLPRITNNSFNWNSTMNDIGIWKVTFEACNGVDNCVERAFIIQVVENYNYLTNFDLEVNSLLPQPFEMECADIDNDDYIELLFTNNPFDNIKSMIVLDYDFDINNFTESYTIEEGFILKKGLELAYFDQDNFIDFVYFNGDLFNKRIQVFLNNQEGSFNLENEIPITSGVSVATKAELNNFNNDRFLDYFGIDYNGITPYWGAENYNFIVGEKILVDDKLLTINSADFNNDGWTDFAVGGEKGLYVYLNESNNTFSFNQFYPQKYGITDIEITNQGSDFNNDNIFDLCISTPSVGGDSSEIMLYLGNGDGSFNQTRIRQLKGQVYGNVVGDYNLDNNLDIAFINGSDKYMGIMYGDGNGTFLNELRFDIDEYPPGFIESYDFDLDGDKDIVVVTSKHRVNNNVNLFINQTDPIDVSKVSFDTKAYNNTDIELVTPSGKKLNKFQNSLSSGNQFIRDLDNNNTLDNYIVINAVESGAYKIKAMPKPNMALDKPFSIEMNIEEEMYRLADEAPMSSLGYEFSFYPDGSSPIYPVPGKFLTELNSFHWQGDGNFDFQLATDIKFDNLVLNTKVNGNSLILPIQLTTTDTTIYYWRVKKKSDKYDNKLNSFNIFKDFSTDINNITSSLPDNFRLYHNYPNPFNPSTTISLDIPYKSEVSLKIYNILGEEVKTLLNRQLSAGSYNFEWNGTDNAGKQVSSGVYLYKLTTNNISLSKKMVLLK